MGGWVEDIQSILKTGVDVYHQVHPPQIELPTWGSGEPTWGENYPTGQYTTSYAPQQSSVLPLLALGGLAFLFFRR